jgi:hypothetical protein
MVSKMCTVCFQLCMVVVHSVVIVVVSLLCSGYMFWCFGGDYCLCLQGSLLVKVHTGVIQ